MLKRKSPAYLFTRCILQTFYFSLKTQILSLLAGFADRHSKTKLGFSLALPPYRSTLEYREKSKVKGRFECVRSDLPFLIRKVWVKNRVLEMQESYLIYFQYILSLRQNMR